jgi:hypothetical protein
VRRLGDGHSLGVHPNSETLIYRDEVLGIIGALADLVVDVRAIRELLEEDDEEEEE